MTTNHGQRTSLSLSVLALGLITVALTFWGMTHYVFPFYAHAYPFAWYGLILCLDGWLYWQWGDGLILRRPREFAVLLFWSAMFWFYFELWNLRLKNWYFVGVPREGWWAHVEAYLDFATVLPGMFLVYRLLSRLKVPGGVRTGFCLPPGTHKASVVVGCIMLVLPLAYPEYFFPMVWGAPAFLLDPLCAKYGGRSLLSEGRRGEWTTLVRLLLAGILCGGYWELCNFWSLEKWIYTVPFFSEGKLFEMPYLGFLGFPPFCVACFIMTNAVYLLRRGRDWDAQTPSFPHEEGNRAAQEPVQTSSCKAIYIMLAVAALALSEWTYRQMAVHTVDSRAEPLEDILKDVTRGTGTRLRYEGWCYPEEVLAGWTEAQHVVDASFRDAVRRRLELATHLHLGSANARLLEISGIHSRQALAAQDADALFERLKKADQAFHLRKNPLYKRRVEGWISAAKRCSFLY